MAENNSPGVPSPDPNRRAVAVRQFEHAKQVINTGNYDYGIQLLLSCCKIDPANLMYRKYLRATECTKYKDNKKGSSLAFFSLGKRAKMKKAEHSKDYLRVLELGEEILRRNPWDVATAKEMGRAAATLGLTEVASFLLEFARSKAPKDISLNRQLARVYEKHGDFQKAIQLWELVHRADPTDGEAKDKARNLAATDTISRGGYENATDPNAKPVQADGLNSAGQPMARPVVDRQAKELGELQERLKKESTNANAYLQLAQFLRKAGKAEEARAVLQQGLGPTGNDFLLSTEIAELEIEALRRNLSLAEDKLKKQPNDAKLKEQRSNLLKEINSRELELYRQRSDRNPNMKSYHFELGVRLYRADQIDEAIGEFQSVRSDPRFVWQALLYLGYCFKKKNNWRLAQRQFEEALSNLPEGEQKNRKEILFQLATGHAEAGDMSHAVEYGYELANLDFAYKDIGRLLEEWQNGPAGGKGPAGPNGPRG